MMLPVLIVGYKRIHEFRELAISCLDAGTSHLYLAIDGNKDGEESLSREFNVITDYLRELYPGAKISLWIRERNIGCAASVISAIDWAFQKEELLAVLEDDLVISPKLLEYWSKNIDQLSSKKIMITGTNAFADFHVQKHEGMTHFPVVWGWATTRDNWILMRNGIFAPKLNYPSSVKKSVKGFLRTGRTRALMGEIDAWDVPLSAWMYTNGYECLVPSVNLVTNRGHGEHATHTAKNTWPMNLKISDVIGLNESWRDSSSVINLDYEMIKMVLKIKKWHVLSARLASFKRFIYRTNGDTGHLNALVKSIALPSADE